MANEIRLSYGIMCDDLEKQANEQGYTFGSKVEILEKLRFSVNLIRIHGLLTDSQADSVYQKLQKKVVKELKPLSLERE